MSTICVIDDGITSQIIACVMSLCYLVTLGIIVCNIRSYLCQQQKYRVLMSLLFYIFATMIILGRLCGFCLLILLNPANYDQQKHLELDIDYASEFLVICIGFCEAIAMYDI